MPRKVSIEKSILTPRETAALLHTSLMYVYHLLWSGTLKGKKVNGVWQINSGSVESYLAK